MSEPKSAIRYFIVPETIDVSPGCGWRTIQEGKTIDGGRMSFAQFFLKLMMGSVASHCQGTENGDATEEFLMDAFRKCEPGQRIELPETIYTVFKNALPVSLASPQGNPELYAELRPFIGAVRRASLTKPEGWATPALQAAE